MGSSASRLHGPGEPGSVHPTLVLPAAEFQTRVRTACRPDGLARHRTFVRPDPCVVRTPALRSYTCSIERLIEWRSRQLLRDCRWPSVDKSSNIRHQADRPLPQEVPMSTITLSPTTLRTSRPARTARPSGVATTGTVRLTRRGRLAVLLVGLLMVLALGVVLGATSVAGERPGTPEPTTIVTVGSGETLWDIASAASQGGDVRDMMYRIERLNALDSGMLLA